MSQNTRFAMEVSLDLKVFIKDVHDKNGHKRPIMVRPWASVKDVKDQLTKHLHVPASSQVLYFGPLLSSAKELPNHRLLQDAGIYRNGETLLLEIKGCASQGCATHGGSLLQKSNSISSLKNHTNDICVSSSTLDLCPKSLQRLVQQSRRGLTLGFKPVLAPDGSGGSYFLSDARKKARWCLQTRRRGAFRREQSPRVRPPRHTHQWHGRRWRRYQRGVAPSGHPSR